MSSIKKTVLLVFVCLIVLFGGCVSVGEKESKSTGMIQTGRIQIDGDVVILTDIHFDPLYDILSDGDKEILLDKGIGADEFFNLFPGDAENAEDILSALYNGWNKVFAGLPPDVTKSANEKRINKLKEKNSKQKVYSETNYTIFQPLLEKMKGANPSFVLFLGDFLTYAFRDFYGNTSSEDVEEKRKIQFSCILYVLESIKQTLNVPIYISLGNSDTFGENYDTDYDDNFAEAMGKCMNYYKLLSTPTPDPAVESTLPLLGYDSYSTNLGDYSFKIININTNYLTEYRIDENKDPDKEKKKKNDRRESARRILEVLDGTLETTINTSEKVWITMHIPPGLNVYNTGFDMKIDKPPREFWDENKTDENKSAKSNTETFMEILNDHGDKIDFIFAGHTHMSEYKFFDQEKNYNYTIINPGAGGMRNGQNPGFSVLSLQGYNKAGSKFKQDVYALIGHKGEKYIVERMGSIFYDKSMARIRIRSLIKGETSFSDELTSYNNRKYFYEIFISNQKNRLYDTKYKKDFLLFRRTGNRNSSPEASDLSIDFWATFFIHTLEDLEKWKSSASK